MESPDRGAPAAADTPRPGASLLDEAQRLVGDYLQLSHDGLRLAELETRISGRHLATMMGQGLLAALLLAATWLALEGAAVVWLVRSGLDPAVALLCAGLASLLLAVLTYGAFEQRSRQLGWPATLRLLRAAIRPGDDSETDGSS